MDHREFFKKPLIGAVAVVLLLAVGSTEGADTVSTVTVLVAYHSVSGNTEKMAQAVSLRERRRFQERKSFSSGWVTLELMICCHPMPSSSDRQFTLAICLVR